ncbi:MAG: hypothetical protein Q8Q09_07220 [Deltaproteobacteria bacterium]|nr:hypothetical protein [Deltaproteobacteria bacterium]
MAISSVVEIVAAILAIGIVRGLSARLAEWFRRVGHNPVESLTAAGIVIDASDAAPAV